MSAGVGSLQPYAPPASRSSSWTPSLCGVFRLLRGFVASLVTVGKLQPKPKLFCHTFSSIIVFPIDRLHNAEGMPGLDGLGEVLPCTRRHRRFYRRFGSPSRVSMRHLRGRNPIARGPLSILWSPQMTEPTHPTLPETLPDSASASAPPVKKRSETIEEQIDGLISYEESGCLCCKRFFCHDERNVSTDSLILEKDRLNLSQLLNYEAIKVGKNFQQEDDAREANRRNCLKILSEAAISVNCLKLPFAQLNTLSMRIKALVITIQVLWISPLWFSVNKFELYQCDPCPTMHPWQNYTYAKYNCLVKSGYFHNRTSSRAEFELIKADMLRAEQSSFQSVRDLERKNKVQWLQNIWKSLQHCVTE